MTEKNLIQWLFSLLVAWQEVFKVCLNQSLNLFLITTTDTFLFRLQNITGTYLSGGAACTWYFNPDIKEAQEYYSRFIPISSITISIFFTQNTT
jgi:hypothetical protein